MAANDNAMTRFLFAILQQKCLKDVDWNKVARDPVLLTPITNGHAARMRYSRFRAQILGHEPKTRNRTGISKARMAKKKKDDAAAAAAEAAANTDAGAASQQPKEGTSKADAASNDANIDTCPPIKPERRSVSIPLNNQPAPAAPMMTIKTEPFDPVYRNSQSLPTPSPQTTIKQERPPTASMPSSMPGTPAILGSTPFSLSPTPVYSDLHSQQRAHIRLLTPSSDSEVMNAAVAASQFSPTGNQMLQHHQDSDMNGFNQFNATGNPQWGHHHSQQHNSPVSIYSAGFAANQIGYGGMDSYATSPGFCDHQHSSQFSMGMGGHGQQQMFEPQHSRPDMGMTMDLDLSMDQRRRSLPPLQTKGEVSSTQWEVNRFVI